MTSLIKHRHFFYKNTGLLFLYFTVFEVFKLYLSILKVQDINNKQIIFNYGIIGKEFIIVAGLLKLIYLVDNAFKPVQPVFCF